MSCTFQPAGIPHGGDWKSFSSEYFNAKRGKQVKVLSVY
jgi:hypothetical protein